MAAFAAAAAAAAAGCGDDLAARPDARARPDAATIPPPPELGPMIDRAGRPMTGTLLVGTMIPDGARRELAQAEYGRATPDLWQRFELELQTNLAVFDALDTRTLAGDGCGNLELPYRELAQLLADDQLFLDATLGVCTDYFSVERAFLRGQPRATCGGRAPSYDAIDTIYSEVIKGISLPIVGDGVAPHRNVNDGAFPFLGPPHP